MAASERSTAEQQTLTYDYRKEKSFKYDDEKRTQALFIRLIIRTFF
jgi:hypothetical protein